MFGLAYATRASLPILEIVHNFISDYCRENTCFYVDNRNIRGFCLYKDGLHLLESGKKILANYFIVNCNIFSRNIHTPLTNIFLNDNDLRRTSSLTTNLQVLHHERLKQNKSYDRLFKYKQSPKKLKGTLM